MKTRDIFKLTLSLYHSQKAAAPNTERVERKGNVSATIWRRKRVSIINLLAAVSQNFKFVREAMII